MENRIITGAERGVLWKIDTAKCDPVIISAKSIKTGEERRKIYQCMRKPIFGYDVDDFVNIDKTLDDMIANLADDGYGDMK